MTTKQGVVLPPLYQDSPESGRIIMRDGATAIIRIAQPDDSQALQEFFERLSPQSRYQRFMSAAPPQKKLVEAFCDPSNPQEQLTLIITRSVGGKLRIIAAASYQALTEKTAEVAFAVDDAFQGRGLGSQLLERLSVLAARYGITRFRAVTMTENQRMLDVFRESGFTIETKHDGSEVEIDLSVVPNEQSVARAEMRDRIATIASLRPFFHPQSVAVVGASRNPTSIGYRIVEGLIMNRFQGAVYPINPKASVICSIHAYPSVRDLPEAPDLAVIAVPPQAVLDVIDDCATRGVKSLVVITAGFAEVSSDGRAMQQQVVEKVRGYGMRMIGPNCLGIISTDPDVQLNASFSPVYPPAGNVAMASQSGALGLAILALAKRLNLGLSAFVSLGNKADVSSNDLLQYWEADEQTKVILLYLESFGNPRRFARLARRVSRSKPVVIVKSGRTTAGSRAAGSHTAAMAASDVAVDALFRQTGVIRAETLDEMFDLGTMLSNQPLPRGRRVAIVTNAGGPGIMCTDACEAGGLQVPELDDATKSKLAAFLPPAASVRNPVDMIASASPEQFRQTVETTLAADEVDALIVIYIPVGVANTDDVKQAINEGVTAARKTGGTDKPVLAVLMTEDGVNVPLEVGKEKIPVYTFPEAAGRVLSKAAAYAEWRAQSLGIIPDFDDIRPGRARAICRNALKQRGSGWLTAEETRSVLEAMHLPVAAGGVAKTADEAVALANEAGYPCAVKLASSKLVHKTEVGGVHLNLRDEAAVRQAFEEIRNQLAQDGNLDAMEGVLVQPMVKGVAELMIGMTEDQLFGPLIAFGLGGIYVEILRDVQFRVTPLTENDAAEMIHGIRGHRLLEGYRGLPPADIAAIQDTLLRISRLVEEVPEITELDLNPIFALQQGQGCSIVDARIKVEPQRAGLPARYTGVSAQE